MDKKNYFGVRAADKTYMGRTKNGKITMVVDEEIGDAIVRVTTSAPLNTYIKINDEVLSPFDGAGYVEAHDKIEVITTSEYVSFSFYKKGEKKKG